MNKYYMQKALKQAKKAYKNNEVPVGAIIVKNNKIISQAYNKREKTKKISDHAEIIAINKACKKLKNWRLDECEIYVTMEPCMMCCGAISQARIKKIYYGVSNELFGFTNNLKNIEIYPNILKNECENLVHTFFKNKR